METKETGVDRERGGLSMVAMFFIGWSMGALMGFILSSRRELEYPERAKDFAGRLKEKAEALGANVSDSAKQAMERIFKASTELFERGRSLAEARKKELLDAIDAGKKTIQEELSKAESEVKGEKND